MSLYNFISADQPLTEINLTGAVAVREHCLNITGEIELWSIWFHEGVQPIATRTQRLAELDAQDLDWLLHMNRCLTLHPKL